MDKDMESRPAPQAAQQGQRPRKSRPRINTACMRCQKRKIRCDALSPACSACKRAGVPCIGGGVSRDYVADLEARVKWLESIIREHVPSIDLNAGPGHSPNTDRGILHGDWNAPLRAHQNRETRDTEPLSEITDQIGLISITTGADLRYLGPSSGLFFTKFVLAGLGKRLHVDKNSTPDVKADSLAVPSDLLVPQPKELPCDARHTRWLSQAYFDIVHLQFPILHEPSHWETVERVYADAEVTAVHEFQVLMVIAIGASILSRRTTVMLSAEGYFASAMKLVDGVMKTSSVGVAQCILLLQMYALNNPTSGLSLWTLHHHGLALAIELGLHRNLPASNYTPLEREVRRRIFWCTYTIDRLLSTLMGRPMGVVDEQCDLNTEHPKPQQSTKPFTNMTSAIHLFKLARFNSEIKCILYCMDHQYPPYTQPAVTNTESWKYHELVMLVLRPNPRFQNPDKASLRQCFSSAMTCSKLYHQLYMANSLHYGWISVHSLFLCVMVMFYCIWTPHGMAEEADHDSLMRALKSSSDVLSAMGEYWPEAKRSRDVLDRVLLETIRRFTHHSSIPQTSPISDSRGSSSIRSFVPPDHTVEDSFMDLPSNRVPLPHNANTGAGDDLFGFNYGDPETSFTSADVLSHFLGSGTDVIMGDSYDVEHIGDREILGWFGDSLRDSGRPY
ncbi:fungal-specific transcription factor domain-containing protein [Aspergillus avenaceus]|uniref:Fungal-specific transcription factor domain-containing protein n=1 Tax=Aspergillus avenaceus TaxID=36643 RepID=A0A5N6TTD3_ASPAV|nr:fungal-specific transcription factor domain-containing protein [Aspergillus avenaceus]